MIGNWLRSRVYVVAVTRWGEGLQQQLPELAAMLGLFPYDLRMRLNGPLPAIVARIPEQAKASTLMAKLREWGHGAVGCDLDTVPTTDRMHAPRHFQFAGEYLHTRGAGNDAETILRDEVLGLIHAITLTDVRTTQSRTSKTFSPTRALVTGGLSMRKEQTKTSFVNESDGEQRLYLVRRSLDTMVFCQHNLRYAGLGDAKGHSSLASFGALVERLRRFAPNAFYDTQLFETRRRSSFVGVTKAKSGKQEREAVERSNVGEVDLAARLLLIAHLRGQL